MLVSFIVANQFFFFFFFSQPADYIQSEGKTPVAKGKTSMQGKTHWASCPRGGHNHSSPFIAHRCRILREAKYVQEVDKRCIFTNNTRQLYCSPLPQHRLSISSQYLHQMLRKTSKMHRTFTETEINKTITGNR